MLLLGLTGPISHGKTTFATVLEELEPSTVHLESSLVIAQVANAMHMKLVNIPDPHDVDSLNKWLQFLPAILQEQVVSTTTFEQIKIDNQALQEHPIEYQKLIMHVENLRRDPGLARQAITNDNKETYRPFLQWLGGYLVQKVDPGIWFKQIIRLVKAAESTGCELCLVGGLRFPTDAQIIKEAGGTIVKVYRPGHLQNDMLDPTERERDNIPVDSTIISNGEIDDLKRCASVFLHDVQSNTVQKNYQTNRI